MRSRTARSGTRSGRAVDDDGRPTGMERSMWALTLYRSTIGKKIIMAVTGLVLVVFVIGHMAGNLQAVPRPGEDERLRRVPARAPASCCGSRGSVLLVAVVLHVLMAYQLTRIKRAARPVGYAKREPQVSHARLADDALGRRAAARLHRLPHPALHDGDRLSDREPAGRAVSGVQPHATSTATSSARSGIRGWRRSTSSRCCSCCCISSTARGARSARSA